MAWLLVNYGVGDYNQLLALAETLQIRYETKKLVRCRSKLVSKLVFRRVLNATLAGIDRQRSSRLEPPWPDLVLSAGRDSEAVAQWIRKQSGGRTRLVHIGRPITALQAFDLIVTTPQYNLPPRKNILRLELPLHRVTKERLRQAAILWRPRLVHFKRPYTAVLVGGSIERFAFTKEKARLFGQQINELVNLTGGSVLITDSARTSHTAFEQLCDELTVPAHIYRWNNNQNDNPYFGYLALADQLVVSGESTSMLAEASSTGKPLFIFNLGEEPGPDSDPDRRRVPGLLQTLCPSLLAKLLRWCDRKPLRIRRDIGKIQRILTSAGKAAWLGQALPKNTTLTVNESQTDLRRAVELIRQLLQNAPGN